MPKCPFCNEAISHVENPEITVGIDGYFKWRGVAYCCPNCDAILGVVHDPILLAKDLTNDIVKAVKAVLSQR